MPDLAGRRRTGPSPGSAACRRRRRGAPCRRSRSGPAARGAAAARLSRSGSRSISVSRLYDGTRRAKPMVSTSGSSTSSIQPSSAGAAPRCRQDCGSRRRASSTSRSRSIRLAVPDLVAGISSHGVPDRSAPSTSGVRPVRAVAARRGRRPRGATQVGACTPLVIEVIGTSSASKPGQRPANISAADLRRAAARRRWRAGPSRKPITAMLNTSGRRPGSPRRRARGSARRGTPGQRVVAAEVLLDQLAAGTGRCRPAPGCGW